MFYNYKQTTMLVDRLSINPDIQKQYRKIFKIFDYKNYDKITALDLKKGINWCSNKSIDDRQIEEIFK